MSRKVASRELAADSGTSAPGNSLRSTSVLSSVLSATFFGMVVVGCAPLSVAETTRAPSAAAPVRTAQIPLPDPSLLTPQPAPDCTYRGPAGTPEEQRQKVDYEQQCYRQAEAIARARLQRLQESVGETIKAVKRRR